MLPGDDMLKWGPLWLHESTCTGTCELNYVSCSPYRVPVARLAAAQAELEFKHYEG